MKFVAAMFAALLALFFVVAAPAALFARAVYDEVFDANAYKQLFTEERLYDRMMDDLAQRLRAAPTDPDAPPLRSAFAGLSEEETRALLVQVLPESAVQPLINDTFDQSFAYLRGESDRIAIALVPLKNGLDLRIAEALIAAVANKPECVREQPAEPFSCKPPAETDADFRNAMREAARQTLANIPDQWVYPANDAEAADAEQRMPLHTRKLGTALLSSAPIVPAALLVLIAVFTVRSAPALLRWWGAPLLLAGAVSLACWYFLRGFIESEMAKALAQPVAAGELVGREISGRVWEAVAQAYFNATLVQSAALVAIGLGMFLLAGVFRRKEPPRIETAEAEPSA